MTTITIDRSVVEQALGALECADGFLARIMGDDRGHYEWLNDDIAALRAALASPTPPAEPAEPVQEPVAQISANRVIAAIEEWKSLWWKVPPFASKVNRVTREAITVSHNPLFALLLDAQAAKQMPKGCTTPSGCQQHGYHGECLPAPPQRKPLTEVELEMAYRDIWRDLPTDFDHTSSGWIEQGIKYAERAHGIGETK